MILKKKIVLLALSFSFFINLFGKDSEIIYPKFMQNNSEILEKVEKELEKKFGKRYFAKRGEKRKRDRKSIYTSVIDINGDGLTDIVSADFNIIAFKGENNNCNIKIYLTLDGENLKEVGSFDTFIGIEGSGEQEELYFREQASGFSDITAGNICYRFKDNLYCPEEEVEENLNKTDKIVIQEAEKKIDEQDEEFLIKEGLVFQEAGEYKNAIKKYNKAYKNGKKESLVYLASAYYDMDNIKKYKSYMKKKEMGKLAENINKEGNDFLAKKEYMQAYFRFLAASKCGDVNAMNNIGRIYYSGLGVDEDKSIAKKWFKKAALMGLKTAMFNLGVIYKKENYIEKSLKWYTKAADSGLKTAINSIGKIYYNGEGVEKDYKKAVEWYIKGSELGSDESMYFLGIAYFEGKGVNKNWERSKELWERAAELGNSEAKKELEVFNEICKIDNKQLYSIKQEGKYGMINKNNEIIVKPVYEKPVYMSYNFIIINKNRKYGLMSSSGENLISAKYDFLMPVSEAVVCFKSSGKYGLMDKKERVVLKANSKNPIIFEENLAVMEKSGKKGYVGLDGKYVIKPQYDDAYSFSNGIAVVKKSGRYGFINTKGEYIIAPKYEEAGSFYDGYAAVRQSGKWGLVDLKGSWKIKPKYGKLFFHKYGKVVAYEEEKFIIKNYNDQKIVKEKFDYALLSEEDVIVVKKGDEFGVLNGKGEYIMPLNSRFQYISKFSNGLASAVENGKEGYINKRGRVVYMEE